MKLKLLDGLVVTITATGGHRVKSTQTAADGENGAGIGSGGGEAGKPAAGHPGGVSANWIRVNYGVPLSTLASWRQIEGLGPRWGRLGYRQVRYYHPEVVAWLESHGYTHQEVK